jgi:hypothetical protein
LPRQNPPTLDNVPGALSVDVDIRLTAKSLRMTGAQVAKIVTATIALVTAISWVLMR